MGNALLHWLKALFRWFSLLLIVLTLTLVLLLFTPLGIKIGFAFLTESVPGELEYQSVTGSIIGPIKIRQLFYRYQDQLYSIDQLTLQWRPSELLAGRLYLETFDAKNILLVTPQAPPPPAPAPSPNANTVKSVTIQLKTNLQQIHDQLTHFYLPFKLEINQANIRNLVWRQHPGEPTIQARNVKLKAKVDEQTVNLN